MITIAGSGGGGTVTDDLWVSFTAAYEGNSTFSVANITYDGTNAPGQATHLAESGFNYGVIPFNHDAGHPDTIYLDYHTDKNWTGSLNLTLQGFSGSGSGNALFYVETACPTAGGDITTISDNASSTALVAAPGSGTKDITFTITGVAVSGNSTCAANRRMLITVTRDGTNACDTFSGPMYLEGMVVETAHT